MGRNQEEVREVLREEAEEGLGIRFWNADRLRDTQNLAKTDVATTGRFGIVVLTSPLRHNRFSPRLHPSDRPQLDSVEGSSLFGTSEPLSNSGVESAATVVAGLESGFLLRVAQATCVQNTLLKEQGDTKTALIGNIPG